MVDEEHRVSIITIKDNEVTVYPHNAGNAFVFSLDNFIGDRIFEREEYDRLHPEAFVYSNGELETILDADFQPNFNAYDTYWAVSAARQFIDKTDNLKSPDTFRVMEEMRLNNEIVIDCRVDNDTYTYYNCETMRTILFSVLHYMVMSGMSFKRCKLCGKLFIPQKPQDNFCSRAFEYHNWKGDLKQYKSCKIARKMIKQSLQKRKEAILDMLEKQVSRNGVPFCDLETDEEFDEALDTFPENKILHEFQKAYGAFERQIKDSPTISNFVEYESYLYISCSKFYKRYGKRGA